MFSVDKRSVCSRQPLRFQFSFHSLYQMLNVTLEESDCFAGWMVLDDVNDLQPLDRPTGLVFDFTKCTTVA